MFGKKKYTKLCKGDIFSLLCVSVILIAIGYQKFVGVFMAERFLQLEQALPQNEDIETYTGQINSVHYEPLMLTKKIGNSGEIANFYVKGHERTLLFLVAWNSENSIKQILVKDGLYSYRDISEKPKLQKNIFSSSIPNHTITILILAVFRILCGLYPSVIMDIVEFPNKLFKVGRFQETVLPFILLCNGGLIIVGFNLFRAIYIVAF